MERIYRYRMTTTSGGNLSIRSDCGTLWITPSQTDKGNLGREDIVCVRANGTVEGRHKPSSEYPFHEMIYETRPDIRAIVHAHPVALVAFSISGQRPDPRVFNRAHAVCGEVGFAPYALPGSRKLGDNIAAEFARGFNCVMLENHGVVVGGATLQEAFERFETLEFTACIQLNARQLGGKVNPLSSGELKLAQELLRDFPTFTPGKEEEGELALREELCRFIHRGYRQRLLTAAQGSFSARLGAESFVITPWEVDRANIRSSDLVLIKNGQQEAGKEPSRALPLHAAIYRRYPEIKSIVLATPRSATAFSITAEEFDARTIPESYIFLRDVTRIPYVLVFGDGSEVAAAVSLSRPAAILENSGVLVVGKSVLDAFDRLEVCETTADAIINARTLGAVRPMGAEVIEELSKAFNLK